MNHKFIIIDLYLFGLIIRYSGNPNKTPPPIILPKVTTIICIAIKPKLAPLPKAPIVKVKCHNHNHHNNCFGRIVLHLHPYVSTYTNDKVT